MSSSSSSSIQWQYIDDDGNTQGPFDDAQMHQWYTMQAFNDDTKVKLYGSDEPFQPISIRFSADYKPSATSTSTSTSTDANAATTSTSASDSTTSTSTSDAPMTSSDASKTTTAPIQQPPPPPPRPAPAATTTVTKSESTSTSTSSPSSQWCYIDEDNHIQGPFDLQQMRVWYKAEFFTPATMVRQEGRQESDESKSKTASDTSDISQHYRSLGFLPMKEIIPTCPIMISDNMIAEAKESKPETKSEKPEVDADMWYYIDNEGVERGPYSTLQMRHWHFRGFFIYNDTKVRNATETQAQTLKERDKPPSFVIAVQRPNQAPNTVEERWFYIDQEGIERGPWTTEQMRAWYIAGYLPLSIKVRQIGETNFTPISGRYCSFTLPPTAPASTPVPVPMMGGRGMPIGAPYPYPGSGYGAPAPYPHAYPAPYPGQYANPPPPPSSTAPQPPIPGTTRPPPPPSRSTADA